MRLPLRNTSIAQMRSYVNAYFKRVIWWQHFERPTVRPRVGGERANPLNGSSSCGGSSPRGRGTLTSIRPARRCLRFIPAWAGNAAPARSGPSRRTVHPRVGGERCRGFFPFPVKGGSSPRGRGTHQCGRSSPAPYRFIPAWAGNAWWGSCGSIWQTVHPRVGGERMIRAATNCIVGGSSPRGRGTRWAI